MSCPTLNTRPLERQEVQVTFHRGRNGKFTGNPAYCPETNYLWFEINVNQIGCTFEEKTITESSMKVSIILS